MLGTPIALALAEHGHQLALGVKLQNEPGLTAGDFNGDGLADMAVYQGSTGSWFIQTLSGQWLAAGAVFGGAGRFPAPGDYDGDGITDRAVFSPDSGTWSFMFSSTGASSEFPLGGSTMIPITPVAWY